MKVHLAFVPPGGGETDYAIEFDMPAIPRAGDYISISPARRRQAPKTFESSERGSWEPTTPRSGQK